MAQPEVSCHPETLLPGARTVVSAALCYYAPEPPLEPGEGRLAALHVARRLRRAARAARRARGAARRRVPRARRREPARRPRGGGAVRRRLLRQEHDADHAPARLVGRARDARHDRGRRSDRTARARLRLVHALHRGVPDRSARRAGRRSMRPSAFRTGRRRRRRSPRSTAPSSARRSTAATSARTSARGTAASRSAEPAGRRPRAPSRTSARRLAAGRGRRGDGTLRPAVRAAQRRALPAAQRARRARQRRQRRRRAARAAVCRRRGPMLQEQARWTIARLEERQLGEG